MNSLPEAAPWIFHINRDTTDAETIRKSVRLS